MCVWSQQTRTSLIEILKDQEMIAKATSSEVSNEASNNNHSAYLPGTEVNRDHEGGSSRVRPFHCTSAGLTPTITPNVGNSSA